MQIRVLYFGALRERLTRTREEKVALADGSTVAQALDSLCQAHAGLAGVLSHVKVAVNEEMASPGQALVDGDVLALLPPVAGGAGPAPSCRLTEDPLSLDEVVRAVSGPGQGGIVTFVGVVRDHHDGKEVVRLEYEAYPSMVRKALGEIVGRCEATAPGVRVAVSHRTGRLGVGDAAVVVAASAPHRAEAFHACRLCIDLLKQEVPIWKKEISPDGEEWIGMGP